MTIEPRSHPDSLAVSLWGGDQSLRSSTTEDKSAASQTKGRP